MLGIASFAPVLNRPSRVEAPPAQAWSLSMPWEPDLHLQAGTWPVEALFDDPPLRAPVPLTKQRVDPTGQWGYANQILPRGSVLTTYYGKRQGIVRFDAFVIIPTLVTAATGSVWMSITPMEAFTLRAGVRAAKGRVLVGGLGLGWQLRRIAEKKTVKEIVVVERSASLCAWYGAKLCQEITERTGTPITLVVDDARDYALRTAGEWDALVFDIWKSLGESKHDRMWGLAREANKSSTCSVWAWGGR